MEPPHLKTVKRRVNDFPEHDSAREVASKFKHFFSPILSPIHDVCLAFQC